MSNSAIQMYALSLDQVTNAIKQGGNKRTILVQGDMGTGKSSILNTLSKELPTHTACYFDCTTKDLGDMMIPKMAVIDEQNFVTYATNEELGVHLNKPIILMIDEFGKSNPAVKNALLRVILERKIGSYTMHPDSIVFATTNKGSEGVGDLLPPHARNRMTVIQTRKPSQEEWIDWGINNKVDATILGWAKDNPQLFHSFEDVKNPEDNPYIYHPNQQRNAFVTPRSLEGASDWVKLRDTMDDTTLTGLLMGTIGERGAMDLMAFVKLADQMPKRDDILKDPKNAKIPTSASAVVMVVFRSLASMSKDYINPFMEYLVRLDQEAQGMFANGVRNPKYHAQQLVMTNKKFTDWAVENNYMFSADKK
jgi:hypothetical protein